MAQQNWQNNVLDKDLLVANNNQYGPDRCIFISARVNSFLSDSGATRGEWPIGVSWNKAAQKFTAKCRNAFSGKYEHLGYFSCPESAHNAWKIRKSELMELLVAEQSDNRVKEALNLRYK